MRPLTDNDIKSELSYAYLHAVSTHAGASCMVAPRSMDGNGIDAILTGWGPFAKGGPLEEVSIHIQLKATSVPPAVANGRIAYFVQGADRYEALRKETLTVHRLLVVLFLPEDSADWLAINDDRLLLKKCAYWLSLRGAPPSEPTGKTVYIPQTQRFDPVNLQHIFATLSRNEMLRYSQP
jgi:hypothetical protein